MSRLNRDGVKLSYDYHVTVSGEIPTRGGSLHDYFNFFTWLRFPNSKKSLNRLQYELQVERHHKGLSPNRTAAEDRLTLLDEGEVLIVNETWDQSPLINRIYIFGHGILEQLYQGKADFSAFGIEFQVANHNSGNFLDMRKVIWMLF